MRRYLLLLIVLFPSLLSAQSVLGRWKTIDDETGKPISVVEIFESHGKLYGKIVEIFNPKSKNKKCEVCPGDDKGRPLLGLVVIKGLVKDGNEYTGGKILDPKHGKLYKCYIALENADKLKVRGYLGLSLLGRTQYWHRVKHKTAE